MTIIDETYKEGYSTPLLEYGGRMDIKSMVVEDIIKAAAFIVMYVVLFLVAKFLKDFLIPYKINHELTKEDNLAVALAMCGYYLASAAIFVGALLGPTQGFFEDMIAVGGYSLLGLVLLNCSRWFNDKAILRTFCDTEQLMKEKNVGVGAVHCGAYLATGLIAAGAVSGQGGGIVSCIVFFILGQLSLVLFSLIYEKFSSYNVHAELLQKNTASGIAFGGNLIALSIVIMNAASGNFTSWKQDITLFLIYNLIAFVFLPVIRLVMDRLVVLGDSLGREIRDDKNIGAGFLEATVAIIFAVILTILL
ncbi:MAG: DUF350 domain-containing protein [Alphaproteobacteria bacterium]|nr:MAG: DUF350 domain-containing protein [Alphaproteobacteria bacterium]TAF13161.1 MAG: DUF350 domain-containing protein [Alphaproteobacteria bacterium]TAF75784.1 MAG: DUF350 domain-containing protein [Alphaproteobacteria bacterium]